MKLLYSLRCSGKEGLVPAAHLARADTKRANFLRSKIKRASAERGGPRHLNVPESSGGGSSAENSPVLHRRVAPRARSVKVVFAVWDYSYFAIWCYFIFFFLFHRLLYTYTLSME